MNSCFENDPTRYCLDDLIRNFAIVWLSFSTYDGQRGNDGLYV